MKQLMIVLFSIGLLSSCAPTKQFVHQKTQQKLEETATIMVIRPGVFASAVPLDIFEDRALIGHLGPKNYLVWDVDASKDSILIWSKLENKARLSLVPEAGKTYYIKQTTSPGFLLGRTQLKWIDESKAKAYLDKVNTPKMALLNED